MRARRAYCFSVASRAEQILQSFSEASSYEELSMLNLALIEEEDRLFQPAMKLSLTPIVEMFREVCADEVRLRQNEIIMGKLLARMGLSSVGSGWLYPSSVDEAPRCLTLVGRKTAMRQVMKRIIVTESLTADGSTTV